VKRQNEWVAQAREDFDFAVEPFSTECSALLGRQYLDCYGTLQSFVASQIHCGHSSLAELTLESVVAGKGVAEIRGNAGIGRWFQILACR
jgi:hypothetical protein